MKTPFITKEKAEEIIKQYPTPFHTTKRVSDREPEIFTRHLAGTKASKSISL